MIDLLNDNLFLSNNNWPVVTSLESERQDIISITIDYIVRNNAGLVFIAIRPLLINTFGESLLSLAEPIPRMNPDTGRDVWKRNKVLVGIVTSTRTDGH